MCPTQFIANALNRISLLISKHGAAGEHHSDNNSPAHSISNAPDRAACAPEHSASADLTRIYPELIGCRPVQTIYWLLESRSPWRRFWPQPLPTQPRLLSLRPTRRQRDRLLARIF